jgi:hypothetical protein
MELELKMKVKVEMKWRNAIQDHHLIGQVILA